MNIFGKNKKISGQAMVEAIVALGLATGALGGIFFLLSTSLSSNILVADQYIASNLAVEGIELVKNVIDKNAIQELPWNSGLETGRYRVSYDELEPLDYDPANPIKIKFDSNLGYGYFAVGSDTKYERFVDITSVGDEIKVVSTVTWVGRGGGDPFSVVLEDHFFYL